MRWAVAAWLSLGLGGVWMLRASASETDVSVGTTSRLSVASARSRISTPADVEVGTDAHRYERLAAAVLETSSRETDSFAAPSNLVVQVRSRPALSGSQVELVELRGLVDGIPLAWPLGHALVDLEDGGRLRLLSSRGTVPAVDPGEGRWTAREAAELLVASGLPGSRGASPSAARRVIVNAPGWNESAWQFDPPLDRESWVNRTFLVGADSGRIEVLREQAAAGWGRVYPINPVTTPVARERELSALSAGAQTLSGPWLEAKSCVPAVERPGCTPEAVAFADDAGNFGFEVPDVMVAADNTTLSDPFAEVSVFHHVQVFDAFLQELGFVGIPCARDGGKATVVSNWVRSLDDAGGYEPFDNALYTGQCDFTMVFGQGATIDFAYEGDVVYHEYAHGVIEAQSGGQLSGLGRRPHAVTSDAGAIGEAIADYLSSAYTEDSFHGDYAARYSSTFVPRDLDNDLSCPGALTGSIHDDSEIFSGALWDAHGEFGRDAFVPIVIDALALFPADVQFEEAVSVLVEMTRVSLGEAEASRVFEAFAARNLERCVRIVPWRQLERGIRLSPASITGLKRRPPPVQLSIDVPPGVERMRLSVGVGTEDGRGPVAVLSRSGSPITFEYRSDEEGTSVSSNEDVRASIEEDDIVLDVEPGTTHYLAFENTALQDIVVQTVDCTFLDPRPGQGHGGCHVVPRGPSHEAYLMLGVFMLLQTRPRGRVRMRPQKD